MISKKIQKKEKPIQVKIETMTELVGILDKYSRESELDSKKVFNDNWKKD